MSFTKCIFEGRFNLDNIEIKNLDLANCEFHQDFLLQNSTIENLSIYGNTFKQAFYFIQNNTISSDCFNLNTFCDKALLNDNQFESDINFEKSTFKKHADFSYSAFGEPSTTTNSTHFDKCIFQEGVSFARSKFYGEITSFYGVKFGRTPSFSQAIFQSNLNLINTSLGFDYEDTLQTISSQAKEKKSPIASVANDFRDSFRLFKSSLITSHNLLDASHHHRAELYCKEIELDSMCPKLFSKEWIEKWQLWFYRLTSDHHTDLLKIIGWVLSVIAGFGILLFACRYGLRFDSFVNHHKNFFLIQFLAPTLSEWITQTKAMGLAYLCFVCGFVFGRLRWIMSLAIVLAIIAIQPKYILGIGGLIGGEVQKYGMFENLLFVFYSLILGLLLFSLQKTARKNSIIPS